MSRCRRDSGDSVLSRPSLTLFAAGLPRGGPGRASAGDGDRPRHRRRRVPRHHRPVVTHVRPASAELAFSHASPRRSVLVHPWVTAESTCAEGWPRPRRWQEHLWRAQHRDEHQPRRHHAPVAGRRVGRVHREQRQPTRRHSRGAPHNATCLHLSSPLRCTPARAFASFCDHGACDDQRHQK